MNTLGELFHKHTITVPLRKLNENVPKKKKKSSLTLPHSKLEHQNSKIWGKKRTRFLSVLWSGIEFVYAPKTISSAKGENVWFSLSARNKNNP